MAAEESSSSALAEAIAKKKNKKTKNGKDATDDALATTVLQCGDEV